MSFNGGDRHEEPIPHLSIRIVGGLFHVGKLP